MNLFLFLQGFAWDTTVSTNHRRSERQADVLHSAEVPSSAFTAGAKYSPVYLSVLSVLVVVGGGSTFTLALAIISPTSFVK